MWEIIISYLQIVQNLKQFAKMIKTGTMQI